MSNVQIDSKNISTIYNEGEIKIIETFIKELLENISPTCSAVAKLSAIKTNESYTLIVNISTMKISFKTRVTAKTRKETIRKFKIHLTKEIERNKTKL